MFSLLSAEDREKLKRVSDSAKQVVAGQSATRAPDKKNGSTSDSYTSPETSSKPHGFSSSGECSYMIYTDHVVHILSILCTLSDIKPFGSDPAKQERYTAFLAGRNPQGDS